MYPNRARLIPGLVLIALGLAFLLMQYFEFGRVTRTESCMGWPGSRPAWKIGRYMSKSGQAPRLHATAFATSAGAFSAARDSTAPSS